MNRIISAIGHFVKHSAVWVSQRFVSIFGADAAHNFAVAAEGLLKSPLGAFALTVVTQLAGMEIPGTVKATQALQQIADQAKATGVQIATSEINLLIETAVQKIKGSFGPGDAPASS